MGMLHAGLQARALLTSEAANQTTMAAAGAKVLASSQQKATEIAAANYMTSVQAVSQASSAKDHEQAVKVLEDAFLEYQDAIHAAVESHALSAEAEATALSAASAHQDALLSEKVRELLTLQSLIFP